MWQISDRDVRALQGNDEKFTIFVDALLRAEMFLASVPDSNIKTNGRTRIPDGGVDTELAVPIPGSLAARCGVPTCWQYKARPYRNVSAKQRTPSNDSEAGKLIRKGYGYRICVADEMPAPTRTKWEQGISKAISKFNPAELPPMVLTASDLAAWANRYPSIVVQFFKTRLGPYLDMELWRSSVVGSTPHYLDVPKWEPTRHALIRHLDLAKPAAQGVLRLQGKSGVGKTRFVFETLDALATARNLVLYTRDPSRAIDLVPWLIRDSHAKVILIVDECSMKESVELARDLDGHRTRIRVVTIDNRGDRGTTPAPELWLEAISNDLVAKILERNFPEIAADRRREYARQSEGFVRLAAYLCEHDAQIAQSGEFAGVLPGIREILRVLVEEKDLRVLQAIALVNHIGFRDDLASELESLCRWLDLDEVDSLERAKRLNEVPGFVAAGGRFFYVTPEIVARAAIEDAWQRWFEHAPLARLGSVPTALLEKFQKSIAERGSLDARDQVSSFFRDWARSLSVSDLSQLKTLDRLLALGETSPEVYVQTISTLIVSSSLDDLRAIDTRGARDQAWRWGPRRYLVWFLEHIAAFPEYFVEAEAALFRLAEAESEPDIANNATGIWRQLFRVVLSGTAEPYSNRMQLLKKRLSSEDGRERALAIGALEDCLNSFFGATKTAGRKTFAGRMVPEDWKPRVEGEPSKCLEQALDVVAEIAMSDVPELRDSGQKLALRQTRRLLVLGRLAFLRRIFSAEEKTTAALPALLERIEEFFEYDASGKPPGQALAPEYLLRVREWQEELTPSDFHGRLVSAVGKDQWHHRITGGENEWLKSMREVASELLRSPKHLSESLKWLASPDAKSATVFGREIGRLDENAILLRQITAAASESGNTALSRGYVWGLLDKHPKHLAALNLLVDHLEATNPKVAYDLFVAGGKRTRALERLLGLVDAGKLEPAYLDAVSVGFDGTPLSDSELCEVLARLLKGVKEEDRKALRVAVSTLDFRAHSFKGDAAMAYPSDQARDLAWQIIEAAAQLRSTEPYHWARVLEALSKFDPKRAARIASFAMAGNIVLGDDAGKVLVHIAGNDPRSVMAALGEAMLDPKVGVYFFIGSHRGVVEALPIGVVSEWLEGAGVEGARKIARQLPEPFLDSSGKPVVPPLTEFVLSHFENDDRTFEEFSAGVGSFKSYFGDIASQMESEAETAKKFRSHRLRRIREWARNESLAAAKQAKLARERQEEFKLR
jgi:hypothetical protein